MPPFISEEIFCKVHTYIIRSMSSIFQKHDKLFQAILLIDIKLFPFMPGKYHIQALQCRIWRMRHDLYNLNTGLML